MKTIPQQKYSVYVVWPTRKEKNWTLLNVVVELMFNFFRFLLQADQLVSEKMTGAEHTKMDEDFTRLEQQTDVYVEMQVQYTV